MSSVPMTELSAPLVDIGDIAYSLKHGAENKNPPSPAPTTEASGRAKLIANILIAVLLWVLHPLCFFGLLSNAEIASYNAAKAAGEVPELL